MIRTCLLAMIACVSLSAPALAQAGPRDGSHDFDFNIGTWHTHIERVAHPLTGASDTVTMEGTVTVRPIWGGKAQYEEIEADGPAGHLRGMTLFLYDPDAHQWSQTFASSNSGTLETPTIGAFSGDSGELYATEIVDGRAILVRGTWSEIRPDAHRYREAYSTDGGQHWQTVFDAHLTRIAH